MMKPAAALWRWLRLSARRTLQSWRSPKGGPAGRLRRRLVLAGAALAALSAVLAFPDAVGRQAGRLCRVGIAQPGLSDTCASWGVPGVPSKQERLAWKAVAPGDCEGLRRYAQLFPNGIFREETGRRLQASRWERARAWSPLRRETVGYIIGQDRPLPTRDAALADTLGKVASDAEEQGCRPVDENERYRGVDILKARPSCRESGRGHTCSLDYRAACRMQVRRLEEICG